MPDDTKNPASLNNQDQSSPTKDSSGQASGQPGIDTQKTQSDPTDIQKEIDKAASGVQTPGDKKQNIPEQTTKQEPPARSTLPKPVVEETSAPLSPPAVDTEVGTTPPPSPTISAKPPQITPSQPSGDGQKEAPKDTSPSPPGGDPSQTPPGAPPNIPPVVTTSKPKKKIGSKKVIATILGILLLIGGVGAGVILVQRQQEIREKATTTTNCGDEPTYNFNRPPSTIGPFQEAGEVTIYYKAFDGGGTRKINLRHNGQNYTITAPSSGSQKDTLIKVSAGDTIQLTSIESSQEGTLPSCAPDKSSPQYAWGWIGVNNDLTCGSGLPGPPSSYTPFTKESVASDINNYSGPIVSQQCWADWREWPGDYDFNDFFLIFSYKKEEPLTCGSLNVDKTTLSSNESVRLSSSTGGEDATIFTYAVYNRDNEYGPGNPKPVCVTSGGDYDTITKDCPDGTHHLSFKDPTTSPRTRGFKTVSYRELFVADKNNGGKILERAQFNAFFGTDDGYFTHSQPQCVAYVSATPKDIPSRTSTPIPRMTFPPTSPLPGIKCECNYVHAFDSDWNRLTKEALENLKAGDKVIFTISGAASQGTIDKARFIINGKTKPEVTQKTPAEAPVRDEFYYEYTIPEGTASFTINAQLHHSGVAGWF